MSAADDMIEDRLARDLALGDPRPPRSSRESAFIRRLMLDADYYERFGLDPPWFLEEDELAMRRAPREPWVRPLARGEVDPATVVTTLIDTIGDTP